MVAFQMSVITYMVDLQMSKIIIPALGAPTPQ